MAESNPQYIVVQKEKSALLAALLGFFFGPIGLLYSTLLGGVLMFIVNCVVGLVTLGFGLFLTWPICALWGWAAVVGHNRRERKSLERQVQQLRA